MSVIRLKGLQALAENDEYKDLSVNEVYSILLKKEEERIEKENKEISDIVNKYKGQYVKFKDNCRLTGNSIVFMHIKSIKQEGWTDEYKMFYGVTGNYLTLSNTFINNFYKSKYNKQNFYNFDNVEIITKEEFEQALKLYGDIQKNLDKIINS